MKLFIEILLVSIFVVEMMGCSSTPRNKWTDPVHRTMINPDGIDSDSYSRIQNSLVNSQKYFVVDRGQAFQAVMTEQNLTRVEGSKNRFDDKEKFSRLRKLYGVGSVVQAHLQCVDRVSLFGKTYTFCTEYLALVSTNTGSVIASAEQEIEMPQAEMWDGRSVSPSWDEAVEKLNKNVPASFEKEQWTDDMKRFKDGNREEALREEEAE